MFVNILLNCKQNMMSLSLLAGRTVVQNVLIDIENIHSVHYYRTFPIKYFYEKQERV